MKGEGKCDFPLRNMKPANYIFSKMMLLLHDRAV